MKDRIFKIMQRRGTRQWQNILPDVINTYNNSTHSSLGIAPADVSNKDTESKLWFKFKQQRVSNQPKSPEYKLNVNDAVRINYGRQPFQKVYFEQNSQQVYGR